MKDETTRTEQTPPADEPSDGEPGAPYLVVLAGARAGEMFRIGKSATLLGRSEYADVRLSDDGVSRRHAVLVSNGASIWLRDLKSANGTYRNGARVVEPVQLAEGDKVSMGGTTILKFTYQDALEEQLNRQLYESAVRDSLTGLYNRRYFDERLQTEMSYTVRHRAAFALMMVDIDHFKRVNDEHGHQVGDSTLREVAKLLSSAVRAEDVIARYGGEEFAILCRDAEEPEATILAERLRLIVAEAPSTPDRTVRRVTISIGIAVAPATGISDIAQLVRAADAALYDAKRQGRNRSVVFGQSEQMRGLAK